MAETPQSPLLVLPGELRNMIYTQVAHSTTSIKLYKGDLVPPPLANTCRQIRYELSGKWYTEEVALDQTLPITAHFTDFDFTPLYKWLEANDKRPTEHKKNLRVLDIDLVLTSPSSGGTSGFASSAALGTAMADSNKSYGNDYAWMRQKALAADYQNILTSDDNWAKDLEHGLLDLGRATYGMDKTARSNNRRLYTGKNQRRRFTETLAGNGYLTSISTRIEYLHHLGVPVVKNNNNNKSTNKSTNNPATATAHPAFAHTPAAYFLLLSASIQASLPPNFATCHHALCVRQFRRRIYSGLVKAQNTSVKLKWDRKYYSKLSDEAKRVVRFYRLLDPISVPVPKERMNVAAAGAGGKTDLSTIDTIGRKRGVGEVYASGKEGVWGMEKGFVDRAWVGCQKRRFGSARGDFVGLVADEMDLDEDGGDEGGGGGGGGGGERKRDAFGQEVSVDVDGLMGRLGLLGVVRLDDHSFFVFEKKVLPLRRRAYNGG